MNCSQNDLAIVVSGYMARLGNVVQCKYLLEKDGFPPLWMIDRVLPDDYGGGSDLEFDKNLRPLRYESGLDETLSNFVVEPSPCELL